MELIVIVSMIIFILTIKFLHHYSIYRLSRKVCNSCLLNGHCNSLPERCEDYIGR